MPSSGRQVIRTRILTDFAQTNHRSVQGGTRYRFVAGETFQLLVLHYGEDVIEPSVAK